MSTPSRKYALSVAVGAALVVSVASVGLLFRLQDGASLWIFAYFPYVASAVLLLSTPVSLIWAFVAARKSEWDIVQNMAIALGATIVAAGGASPMAKYLVSFPSAAMVVPAGDLEHVSRDAHAVIDQARAAGVYVFGGGIDEGVPPVLVSADGAVTDGGYPWAPPLNGGFTVIELPSREDAVTWAARIAKACRCSQELRVFGFDPQS